MISGCISAQQLDPYIEEAALSVVESLGGDWRSSPALLRREDTLDEKLVHYLSTNPDWRIEKEIKSGVRRFLTQRYGEHGAQWLEIHTEMAVEAIVAGIKAIDDYCFLRLTQLGLSETQIKAGVSLGWIVTKGNGKKTVASNQNKTRLYNQIQFDPYLILGVEPSLLHQVATSLGIDHQLKDVCTRIVFEINELCRTGKHVCYPLFKLIEKMPYLAEGLKNGMDEILKKRYGIVIKDGYIYVCYQLEIEDYLTNVLTRVDGDQWFDVEQNELNDLQRTAQMLISNSPVTILTGGPGTGKSFTIRKTIPLLTEEGIDHLILTPTGKAALNIGEGRVMTCHKFLASKESLKLKRLGYIFFDESSMLVNALVAHICIYLPLWRFVFVGDPEQLQPIGCGDFFTKAIESASVPMVRLDTVYRQQQGSFILDVLDLIRKRLPVSFATSYSLERIDLIEGLLQTRDKTTVKIICPTWKDVNEMNKLARKVYIDDRRNTKWKKGTMVMMTKNFYDVEGKDFDLMNGTEGEVVESDSSWIKVKFVTREEPVPIRVVNGYAVDSDDEEESLIASSLDEGYRMKTKVRKLTTQYIKESFAITVHSAQGSGWDTVIFYSTWWPNSFVNRPLVYTAFSRAKKELFAFTREGFLKRFARENPIKRHDNLKYRLLSTTPKLVNPCPAIQTCEACRHLFEHAWESDVCTRCKR